MQTRHDLSCGYYFQQNSGDVRSRGLELETRIQATAALHLGFSASYTDAVANGPIRNLDAPNGARVPYFPRAIATLDATYAIPLPSGSLLLQADDEFHSREGTEFDTTGTLFRQLPSTRVLNAAGTWILGNTEWTLFARNLTNTPILSAIHANGYAPFQPGDIVYLQRPRTLGLKVKVSFGPSAR